MTRPDYREALHGQISRCECGTESPPDYPDAVTAWEEDHLLDCPVDTTPQWDDVIEDYTWPRQQVFTRRQAPLPTTGPASHVRHRMRIDVMRDYLDRHKENS